MFRFNNFYNHHQHHPRTMMKPSEQAGEYRNHIPYCSQGNSSSYHHPVVHQQEEDSHNYATNESTTSVSVVTTHQEQQHGMFLRDLQQIVVVPDFEDEEQDQPIDFSGATWMNQQRPMPVADLPTNNNYYNQENGSSWTSWQWQQSSSGPSSSGYYTERNASTSENSNPSFPAVEFVTPVGYYPQPQQDNTGRPARTIRRRHNKCQLAFLQQYFSLNPRPNSTMRHEVAQCIGLTTRQITTWFQNRRAKVKRDHRRYLNLVPHLFLDHHTNPM